MTSKRTSILWPLLILAIAALWAAQSLGVLPASAVELVSRAWPVALVTLGLLLLLGRRVRFGNIISIALSAVLVVGMMVAAVGRQGQRFSTDQQKPFAQVIDPQVTSVKIVVNMLNTQIDVTAGGKSAIIGEFIGSKDSLVTADYKVDGTTGTLTLGESQNSTLPSLESLGRGKLTLALPIGPTISQVTANITGRSGDVSLDAAGTALTDLTITAEAGGVKLGVLPETLANLTIAANAGAVAFDTLPNSLSALTVTAATGDLSLDAASTSLKNITVTANAGAANIKLPNKAGLIGTIKASGDVTISVPASIAASVKLAGNASNNPTYNQGDYILTIDKTLISRRSNDQQMQITVDTPNHATIQ